MPSIYINHCLSVIEFLDIELDVYSLQIFFRERVMDMYTKNKEAYGDLMRYLRKKLKIDEMEGEVTIPIAEEGFFAALLE